MAALAKTRRRCDLQRCLRAACLVLQSVLTTGCHAPYPQPIATERNDTFDFGLSATDSLARLPDCEDTVAASSRSLTAGNKSADEAILAGLPARVLHDHQHFYSSGSLALLAGGFAVAGGIANTSIDDSIHRHFQASVRNATSDDWFESLHASKELGNGFYTLPVFASAWVCGEVFSDLPSGQAIGTWGERSIRGFMVGAPPLIVLQQLTGGSRPDETQQGSHWQPLKDNNGISGHSFMGACRLSPRPKCASPRLVKRAGTQRR